ncbi:hypothetical protein F4820DRAFT_471586 [Hypoxylon rubiginosum]|uniref:Uncharacterized protein n=1 Tax=Hypoxylon rubiginosum TaxID=110542 RepID=A0ACB9YVP8_9PEZI|nr:hypothetical protein F4820DRAFT_471586 [Hypoxylon rubiginosum]
MDSFQQTIERLRETFVRDEVLSRRPEIMAIFLGGSQLYKEEDDQGNNQLPRDTPRDWDGAILVNTKHDIFTLVNDHRQDLMDLIGIETEECPRSLFQVPSPSSQFWPEFDAVRFAGFGKSSEKRGVKILSWEYFSQGTTSLNILSYKDKRVYKIVRPGPSGLVPFCIIQQANTLPNGLMILHDQWVFKAPQTADGDPVQAAFGVTADLLVSGACLLGREPFGLEVKRKLLAHYSLVTGQQASFTTFSRCCRFSSSYTDWLNQELKASQPFSLVEAPFYSKLDESSSSNSRPVLSFSHADRAHGSDRQGFFTSTNCIPTQAYRQFEEGLASRHGEEQTPFAVNSQAYTATVGENSETPTEIFCKESLHPEYTEDEIKGAKLASLFYPRVQLPLLSSTGALLYPLFQGTTESAVRLSYIKGGRSDWSAAELLLYMELVKAEDILRGYRKSLAHPEKPVTGPDYKIQRFYHTRLINDVRLRDFYGPTIQLMGNAIPRDTLLGMQWVINGVRYPSLRELFDAAYEILKPSGRQISSCPVLFGHGDAHGGNLMVSSEPSPNSSPEVLLIDYEVCDYHPVMLDLAKPMYMDIFFESLYLDLISPNDEQDVKGQISGNTIIVEFVPKVDWLTQAIFDIKMRYIIRPLCEEIRNLNQSLEYHVPLLSSALFLCGAFARSSAKDEKAFLLNFSIGILLAGAKTWDDLYSGFEKLGFKTPN